MATKNNKFVSYILLAVASLAFCGCSKDKEPATGASRKVFFRATATGGSTLDMAVYGYDATLTTVSSLGGQSWQSPEITVPAGATLASVTVNARGATATSGLIVQIHVGGALKKTATGSGAALTATAQHNLK